MRFTIGIVAAVGILVSSGMAWAIYKETTVTIAESGKPLPNATVNLTVKSPPVQKFGTKTMPPKTAKKKLTRIVERKRAKTDSRGVMVFGYDDNKLAADAVVDLLVKTADGRTLTKRDVPLTELAGGGTVNVVSTAGGPAGPSSSRLDARQRSAGGPQLDESRLSSVGRRQHDASVLLAQLRDVRPACLSKADRDRYKVAFLHFLDTVPSGRSSPGMEQFREAIDGEIKRIDAIPDCPPTGISVSGSGSVGEIHRPDFGTALQTESGGVINNRDFGAVERKDSYQGFGLKGSIGLATSGFGSVIFGYSYGKTSTDSFSDTVSTGGDDLNILSPQGPAGGLGGGVNVGGAFSDIANLRYTDSYDEQLGYIGVSFAPWRLPGAGTRVTPYVKGLFGYVHETSDYSGTTAGGILDFLYTNELKTTRWGAAVGANVMQPLSGPLGLYLDGELRFIENDTSASSTLNLSGVLDATEPADASARKFDVGGMVGGGLYYKAGNVTVKAGASYETWQVPIVTFSETGPLRVDYGARESITATLQARVKF